MFYHAERIGGSLHHHRNSRLCQLVWIKATKISGVAEIYWTRAPVPQAEWFYCFKQDFWLQVILISTLWFKVLEMVVAVEFHELMWLLIEVWDANSNMISRPIGTFASYSRGSGSDLGPEFRQTNYVFPYFSQPLQARVRIIPETLYSWFRAS